MSDEQRSLDDEIQLRQASVTDARREHADGELDDATLASIIGREESSIAALRARRSELAGRAATVAPRRHRRTLLYVAAGCFALAALGALIGSLTARSPNGEVSGSVPLSRLAKVELFLGEAEAAQARGNSATALTRYDQVLALEATNVEALTQSGWLEFSAGSSTRTQSLVIKGEQRVATAVALAPTDPDPRLYYAIIAASTPGRDSEARTQFRKLLTLHPSAAERAIAAPFMRRLGLKL